MKVIEVGGVREIESAVLARSGAVLDCIRSLGADVIAPWRSDRERAGIVTFRLPGRDTVSTVAALGASGFLVSERNGWIRVAPHATTPMQVIEAFGDALTDQVRKA